MDEKSSHDTEVTALLERWGAGETGVLQELVQVVYADLRRIAEGSMRRERGDHTLQPTALVHEAYLRLAGSRPPELRSREHFLCLAARLMRQILVDHARRLHASRRGAAVPKVPLDEAEPHGEGPRVDLIALDHALEELARIDERKARVIELRFFGGFEVREVAEMLGISVPTVVTDTRFARAWLLARLDQEPP